MSVTRACLPVLVLLVGGGQVSAAGLRPSYCETVLADDPRGYWRLGETSGSTAFDASGNELHGEYVGGVTLGEPGRLVTDSDTAAFFDGSTGYVDKAQSAAANSKEEKER